MPTPNVVTLLAVVAAMDAAMTAPYSFGARYRASSSVPNRPTALEPMLVGSVQAAPLTARCLRVDVATTVTPRLSQNRSAGFTRGPMIRRLVGAFGTAFVRTVKSPPSEERKVNAPWLEAGTVPMVMPLCVIRY